MRKNYTLNGTWMNSGYFNSKYIIFGILYFSYFNSVLRIYLHLNFKKERIFFLTILFYWNKNLFSGEVSENEEISKPTKKLSLLHTI